MSAVVAEFTEAMTALGEKRARSLMDDLRVAMEGEMEQVRTRCETYLRWYSPPFNTMLGTHDAWRDPITYDDIDTTRANFTLSRAVVDIWAALEASKPPTVRAEPERIRPPLPILNPGQARAAAQQYAVERQLSSVNSDIRSARIRQWMRDDNFALKHHTAVKRKDLYGFSWMKVLPQPWARRPLTGVLRNPITVYPLWSSHEPGELEAVFSAQQMSARQAHARWPELPIAFHPGSAQVAFERGEDSGRYRDLNDRWFDQSRTQLWVEELWWLEREYTPMGKVRSSRVWTGTRVMDRIVNLQRFEGWTTVPFVYWENTDERDSWGWSDIAGVIDINDEFNRRVSQQGDVIRLFSSPRFMFRGGLEGRDVDLPGPFKMVSLQDQETIEQILTRIDVYPTVQHFDILTDLLHRVSGLPPIVWGLIANAQTSGRALSASWKATEARLAPKLMRNELSARHWLRVVLDQARHYDWYGAKEAFADRRGDPFDDFTWKFPPMEPRDFTEVGAWAVMLRDAGLIDTPYARREVGIEDAEEMDEAVTAEFNDITKHPDKVNARIIAERAEMENIAMAQQLQQPPQAAPPPGGPPPAGPPLPPGPQAAAPPGMEGSLPPTQQGAPGNAGAPIAPPGGSNLTSGTLVRNGDVSTQLLATQQF